MNANLRYVGIGVWGAGGNLINAAPQVHTQDFAVELATPHYPNVRIHSGSHVFIGSGTGTNMNSMQFFANYFFSSAPTSAKLWLEGNLVDLTCKAGWGPSGSNCVYTSDVIATTAGCRLYFFQFADSAGTTRYPESGAYYTYGEGSCRRDWIPASEADPIINGGGTAPINTVPTQTTAPGATQTTAAGGAMTTPVRTTVSIRTTTVAAITQTFPTAPPGGTNPPGGSTNRPSFLVTGARGARLRIRYLANFVDYVAGGSFTVRMETLRNTTAPLVGVSRDFLGAESAREGSVIVEWFVVDPNGVAGSAAAIVDGFLARLAAGADPLIGNHNPPLIDASLVARDAILGSPAGSALDLAIIIGVAVGGVVFLVLLVIAIVLLVRYFRNRHSYSRVGDSKPMVAASARFDPVVSRFYGSPAGSEPLIEEPLLYLARNSRAASERVQSHRQSIGVLPNAIDLKDKQRAQVLFDFDGSSAPNCLTVFKGEIVTIDDRSNPDW